MEKRPFTGVARKGITHQFMARLFAFEHTSHTAASPPQNVLIFVGGLFDGLHTVPYTSDIAAALPPSWTIAQAILASSYTGWGTSSLQRDVKELSSCVAYFRTIKSGKVVLMGHSTGCQDVMEYLTGLGHETRAPIDGAVIQAPVSDREGMVADMEPEIYKKSCAAAAAMVASGNAEGILPSSETGSLFPAPVTARRYLSLASPNHDSEDDYFSSDLTDEQLVKTFGGLPASSPLCILFSGSDEYVPEGVDKEALVGRWIGIAKGGKGKIDEGNSAIILGAKHNASGDPEVLEELLKRVLGFLNGLTPQTNL